MERGESRIGLRDGRGRDRVGERRPEAFNQRGDGAANERGVSTMKMQRMMAGAVAAVFASGALLVGARPAEASSKGRLNTTIALGAATAYALTKRNKTAAVVLGVGTAVAYKRYSDKRKQERREREYADRYYDRYDDRYDPAYDDRYSSRDRSRRERVRDTRWERAQYNDRYDRERCDRDDDRYSFASERGRGKKKGHGKRRK
jgi:hypothetical protein